MRESPRQAVRKLIGQALSDAVQAGVIPQVPAQIPLERAKRAEHGDFATNVAMLAAKGAGKPPRVIADAIVARLATGGTSALAEASVAGPGFINLRLSNGYWQAQLGEILAAGDDWGRGESRATPRVLLEYLSANPTGPMHVGHGRQAAIGDALARLLRFAGYDVTTEFYVNDAGNQVHMLSLSVWARYMEALRADDPSLPAVAFPENGYKGGYVRDFARALVARDGRRWAGSEPPADLDPIKRFAIDQSLAMIRATLERFSVTFDSWQSERALHESGAVAETLSALDKAGYIDRKEDAVWLKTTVLWGDDKDRVVVKSDGIPTYLLADIAYHRQKLARGYHELCDIWGADHHGHVPKMQAALKAFGHDPTVLQVILVQMVALVRDGKPVAMGKREGEFVTLDDVMEEVGRDATRLFYLMRRNDSSLEFDLELAKRQSMDNPVYYVQYAHARCASLLRRAAELGAPKAELSTDVVARLALPEEISILKRLAELPDFVADAAEAREPHRLFAYAMELAGDFQSYYTRLQKVHDDTILPQERHRVGDWRATWDWSKSAARLLWVQAIGQVMRTSLGLLGVSAPESMQRTETAASDVTKEDES